MTDDYNWRRGNNRWLILGKLVMRNNGASLLLELPLVRGTKVGKARGAE